MKRLMSQIKKKKGGSPTPNGDRSRNGPAPMSLPEGDAPDAVVVREVVAFCESGAPGSNTAGDEYLHLPAIVDAAESSPTAAREAANTIARYLSKDNYAKGYAQYNSIMITRILTDNPGRPFTQHFDANFISTVKHLLRECRDQNVQQITRETLDYFEAEKLRDNDSLNPLMQMWKKEKSKSARFPAAPVVRTSDVFVPTDADETQYPNGMAMQHGGNRSSRHPRQLPPPDELAARIEEAKTTARLLIQTVQSTPQQELLGNELVKEFAERARSAHKSIQNYMNCENPAPDEDTMLTLIETNDQLNVSMSKHQRAVLQARKAAGIASPTPPGGQGPEANSYMQAHTPGQNVYQNVYSQPPAPPQANISPVSPVNNSETFSPPLGPPPQQRTDPSAFAPPPGPPPSQSRGPQQGTFEYEDAYAPAPHIPALQPTQNRPGSRNAEYGVADNPFSDDNVADETQPKPNQNSLFARKPPQPSQSYMQRQESSTNNLTMHGGSLPPNEQR
ncbi:uncharacterized protein HMPREF1541_00619 [Cyphellophora europaea CBS 101466]|uniref:GAT domain-containing protein n=1 Tax=Cyphellophora europaea (strain CBS 101466) TaxID=1220924 RepID=W2SCU9_CYPE1|nr:uncharacterized protein HMPREF1541_00619 [Cyphellophora europaea CBS 101466]ETN46435.1 hypothetical protein HMPREF1541_00619 [Cyphellophora europaea CBS 101466]